ncbi:hypothetical protein BGW42_007229 [Actinomortierella wolfii]|nr:hypothetical protein BGW42_007229 [Actinomortierella wolfii]
MELAERGTLSNAINKGFLSWQDKTRIAHEIARGFEFIHQEDVLHRDLKNANVLLTRHMEAKLADFGLARARSAVSSGQSMSSSEERLHGMLEWIAPELFEADRPSYSTKTDIYAFGVVMWEMAANCTHPCKDQDNRVLFVHHVKSGDHEKLPDDTPTGYREWIECCWHQDPSQRPDASEVNMVDGQQEESDDDAVDISLTFNDDEITLVNTEAERDNATAQLLLRKTYENGEGVESSNVEAARWYRKTAVHGLAKVQFKLGRIYEEGRGVKQDDVEAVRWYSVAADQG